MLVYLHGGGWVAGSVATHDPFCRLLSEAAEVIIASIDTAQRRNILTPQQSTTRSPPCDGRRSMQRRGDVTRLALGGDSAGANLAAVVANRLCATAEEGVRALLLLYPVTDPPQAGHPSYIENATGYGLEANIMRWFWQQYAPGVSPDDPDVSPLQLHNLPASRRLVRRQNTTCCAMRAWGMRRSSKRRALP